MPIIVKAISHHASIVRDIFRNQSGDYLSAHSVASREATELHLGRVDPSKILLSDGMRLCATLDSGEQVELFLGEAVFRPDVSVMFDLMDYDRSEVRRFKSRNRLHVHLWDAPAWHTGARMHGIAKAISYRFSRRPDYRLRRADGKTWNVCGLVAMIIERATGRRNVNVTSVTSAETEKDAERFHRKVEKYKTDLCRSEYRRKATTYRNEASNGNAFRLYHTQREQDRLYAEAAEYDALADSL